MIDVIYYHYILILFTFYILFYFFTAVNDVINSTFCLIGSIGISFINNTSSVISSIIKFSCSFIFKITSLTLGSVLRNNPFVAFTIRVDNVFEILFFKQIKIFI
ncbi:hypothetical protein SLOPH_1059 [Spraguea lophii 42_110]|uniref:Uncharacterized protein n=1 Tax=Spraguea lophii (strain 42_110) TaxID=1358809 RepID=S7W752_SPRLO|nr:hypothetical protein SLOPH_1059 [Spraguea lophii 42_110]